MQREFCKADQRHSHPLPWLERVTCSLIVATDALGLFAGGSIDPIESQICIVLERKDDLSERVAFQYSTVIYCDGSKSHAIRREGDQ